MKGSIEACCRAEVEIMRKLREAYENDIAAINVSVCGYGESKSDSLSHHVCVVINMISFRFNSNTNADGSSM